MDLFKKKKEKLFLALDIGTVTVKALIFSSRDKKIRILGAGLEYFGQYDVFSRGNFKSGLIRETIIKTIGKARSNLPFSLASKELKIRAQKKKKWQVLLGLAPNILKARVVCPVFLREKPKEKISKKEEKIIYEKIFKSAKKEISQRFSSQSGILSSELYWISLKVLEAKIDGYPVSDCKDYQGEKLEFKVLISFLPKYYLESIKKIVSPLKFKNLEIIHPAENLHSICQDKKKNGIFLDVGGEVTQIFEIKNSQLKNIAEFKYGGEPFIESLSQRLGLDRNSARSLAEKYFKRSLSREARERIKEIFLQDMRIWHDNLKKELENKRIKAGAFYLFGGGSIIPEIESALEQNLISSRPVSIEPVYLEDLESIIDTTNGLESAQYIPCLLLTLSRN